MRPSTEEPPTPWPCWAATPGRLWEFQEFATVSDHMMERGDLLRADRTVRCVHWDVVRDRLGTDGLQAITAKGGHWDVVKGRLEVAQELHSFVKDLQSPTSFTEDSPPPPEKRSSGDDKVRKSRPPTLQSPTWGVTEDSDVSRDKLWSWDKVRRSRRLVMGLQPPSPTFSARTSSDPLAAFVPVHHLEQNLEQNLFDLVSQIPSPKASAAACSLTPRRVRRCSLPSAVAENADHSERSSERRSRRLSATDPSGERRGSNTDATGEPRGSTAGDSGAPRGSTTEASGERRKSTTDAGGGRRKSTTGATGERRGSTTGTTGERRGSTTGASGERRGSTTPRSVATRRRSTTGEPSCRTTRLGSVTEDSEVPSELSPVRTLADPPVASSPAAPSGSAEASGPSHNDAPLGRCHSDVPVRSLDSVRSLDGAASPAEEDAPRWKQAWHERKNSMVLGHGQGRGLAITRAASAPFEQLQRLTSHDSSSSLRRANSVVSMHSEAAPAGLTLTSFYKFLKNKYPNVQATSSAAIPPEKRHWNMVSQKVRSPKEGDRAQRASL